MNINKVDRIVYTFSMSTKKSSPSARERILLNAHDLFYSDGIRATGVDRIIKEANVTKVTFYRHFPSKNNLIRSYLEFRHAYWMAWFTNALERHEQKTSDPQEIILGALSEWFRSDAFRGCAFINAVVELDGTSSEISELTRTHKKAMESELKQYLQQTNLKGNEEAVAMAIDGAIIQAQIDTDPSRALQTLKRIVCALAESN